MSPHHLTTRQYQDARNLLAVLETAGFPAMLAGGCVRDRLLAAPPEDYDIATVARPEEVDACLSRQGFRVIPTGISHGTVTVICRFGPIEVTTLRRDVATDGRHAEVEFGTSFEDDAKRRDFTINAMFEDQSGKIFDYVGGQDDLKARRLRFVGDADQRIKEDYLRILRLFRFWGRFDFIVDQETLAVIRGNGSGISRLSQERVTAEMLKVLGSPYAGPALQAMEQTGIWPHVIPEMPLPPLQVLQSILAQVGKPRDLSVLLGMWVTMPAPRPSLADLSHRLRLSTKQGLFLQRFVDLYQVVASQRLNHPADQLIAIEKAEAEAGQSDQLFGHVYLPLLRCDQSIAEPVKAFAATYALHGHRLRTPMPVTGRDLMAEAGLPPGELLGSTLLSLRRQFLLGAWQEKRDGIALAKALLGKQEASS
jgi:tRNA nucleotidyltransferase/poly(A) polymerase